MSYEPLIFFLSTWASPKGRHRPLWIPTVYMNKPGTLVALKKNLREEVGNISPEVLRNVMRNAETVAQMFIQSSGAYLNDMIFAIE